jgi:imidazolonepropionase-like amidohydrolase
MANVLFTNVRVIDGSGEYPFTGEVLVQGNRIRRVARGSRNLALSGVTVIDGAGATLMPGMTEAHTHFSWNDQPSLDAIFRMPPEEHTLFAAAAAKTYLDSGFTSCVGAAAAKPRLDVVIRNAINSGQIPGPRYLANSQEIGTVGGLGDTAPPHVEHEGLSFACIVSGPEEMRRAVRRFIKYGVDLIKLNLSGEEIAGVAAEETPMDEDEIVAAVREARRRGKRVCAHARSAESVKLCVKHGIEIIYHASFADEAALDLLDKHKDKHFVAPGLAWLIHTARDAAEWGIKPGSPMSIQYERELAAACETMKKMHKRGIRVLPGGDYGFAWIPHGTNAKDLEYFVSLLGFTPMEALLACTKLGGEIMGHPNELGQVKEGYFADLLLVDGDPLSSIKILQEKNRLLAIMKDGEFHKWPDAQPGRMRMVS